MIQRKYFYEVCKEMEMDLLKEHIIYMLKEKFLRYNLIFIVE